MDQAKLGWVCFMMHAGMGPEPLLCHRGSSSLAMSTKAKLLLYSRDTHIL